MAQRTILVSTDEFEKRVAVLSAGKLQEYFLERSQASHLAGNIYKGKVAQIVKAMEAAFVDIGLPKNGFLHVQEFLPESLKTEEYSLEPAEGAGETPAPDPGRRATIDQLLNRGQEVVVQVVKEPFGTKGCRLTTQISLPGRFLVLMPYSRNVGISKRITNEKERQRLKDVLREINFPKDMGCILRTQAEGRGKREFEREMGYLLRLWRNIKTKASRHAAPCLLHEEYDLVLRVTRDSFGDDVEQLILDNKDDFHRVNGFIQTLAPHLRRNLRMHKDRMQLFEKYDVDRQSAEIFQKQVQLKRGGYIVIERTEALISIDINSGRFVTGGRLEETAFLTNMDAAEEVARQILLRDLAGIIVIDFIDMEKSSNQRRVLQALSQAMEKDKARSTIYQFSPLGLVQIARQRVRKSIESVLLQECSHCTGRGKVKSVQTVAIEVMRKIRLFLLTNKKRYLEVNVHPEIAMRLLNEDRAAITSLEKRFWIKIAVLTDEHLGLEEVRFI